MNVRYEVTLLCIYCQVLCAKVVGATSSEGFLVASGITATVAPV